MRGNSALAELEHWVTERGFRGLSLRPFMIGRPATDRAYFPFYAKCVELGIPLSIHTSANWTRTRPSELGHPRHIDEVACHFPDLTILMSHAGYPWVLEACLVAWKHPNVYLELGAHRPKYFATPGAGWERCFGSARRPSETRWCTVPGRFSSIALTGNCVTRCVHSQWSRWPWRTGCGATPLGCSICRWARQVNGTCTNHPARRRRRPPVPGRHPCRSGCR